MSTVWPHWCVLWTDQLWIQSTVRQWLPCVFFLILLTSLHVTRFPRPSPYLYICILEITKYWRWQTLVSLIFSSYMYISKMYIRAWACLDSHLNHIYLKGKPRCCAKSPTACLFSWTWDKDCFSFVVLVIGVIKSTLSRRVWHLQAWRCGCLCMLTGRMSPRC